MRCALVAMVAACHVPPVAQDRATGKDGTIEGAYPILLDGTMRGTVSYPRGDRIDWFVVELPPKPRGVVDVEMQWTGSKVTLQVWSADYVIVRESRGTRKRRSIVLSADELPRNILYLRVFAPRRQDAGSYSLRVRHKEQIVFHRSPEPHLEPRRSEPPMECPACLRPPVHARAIKIDEMGDHSLVWLAAGTEQGIEKTWSGTFVRDDETPIDGGEFEIIRVDKRITLVKTKLGKADITANPRVRLSAP